MAFLRPLGWWCSWGLVVLGPGGVGVVLGSLGPGGVGVVLVSLGWLGWAPFSSVTPDWLGCIGGLDAVVGQLIFDGREYGVQFGCRPALSPQVAPGATVKACTVGWSFHG